MLDELLEPISKIAFEQKRMSFRAKRMKDEEEYRGILTSLECAAAEIVAVFDQNGFLRWALIEPTNDANYEYS